MPSSRNHLLLAGLGGAVLAGVALVVILLRPPSTIASGPTPPPANVPTLAGGAGIVQVAGLAASPQQLTTLISPQSPSTIATLDAANNSTLAVNGHPVATGVGRVFWSNDGTTLFYAKAPPVASPLTPEPLYAFAPATGTSRQLAIASDPWRLSVTGPQSIGFNDAGTLAIADGRTGAIAKTTIPLAGDPSHKLFGDADFQLSPDARYAAVLSAANRVTMYRLPSAAGGSTAIQAGAAQMLRGTVAGNRQFWGGWKKDSTAFLYAVQTDRQTPRLELWSAASQGVLQLGGALAPANERGQYLVIGWIERRPGTFLVEQMPAADLFTGRYLLGDTTGNVVQTLWVNGLGGTITPDEGEVFFSARSSHSSAPSIWVAHLSWR